MSIIFLVVPLATLVVLAAVIAFVWAARRGQFDDLDSPAIRMLHDDAQRGRPASSMPQERGRGSAARDGRWNSR